MFDIKWSTNDKLNACRLYVRYRLTYSDVESHTGISKATLSRFINDELISLNVRLFNECNKLSTSNRKKGGRRKRKKKGDQK